ncbi:MAG: DNA adenine methylase [Clostridium sp.]|nr:DNA adenine methylase [Acetatifactor muris]MCM1526221.1 DNA adenine methylase [Bacteroides sp.]MCM1562631.1 DNA adenine methylase [Clostridium sp.]
MYRYIGNKTKLLPILLETIAEEAPSNATVVDLMSGTGSVAVALRKQGYHVIASDMMTYSKHHLVTQLLLNSPPSFQKVVAHLNIGTTELSGYEAVLRHLNSLPEKESYFFNEFSPDGTPSNGSPSRKYFTSQNAKKIDAIREQINAWIENDLITSEEESVLKHTLIMAVNDVANISGTYGYFLSKFNANSLEPIALKPIQFVCEGNTQNTVIQGFAENIASGIVADVCYIDPPYMKRQYAANYHILETIARGDFPETIGKSGLRNWWDQHSKFCTKTKIRESFSKVITEMSCNKFIISYSEDGLLSLDELIELFSMFGTVTYKNIEYSRFRSNNSNLSKKFNEYIIILAKRESVV